MEGRKKVMCNFFGNNSLLILIIIIILLTDGNYGSKCNDYGCTRCNDCGC